MLARVELFADSVPYYISQWVVPSLGGYLSAKYPFSSSSDPVRRPRIAEAANLENAFLFLPSISRKFENSVKLCPTMDDFLLLLQSALEAVLSEPTDPTSDQESIQSVRHHIAGYIVHELLLNCVPAVEDPKSPVSAKPISGSMEDRTRSLLAPILKKVNATLHSGLYVAHKYDSAEYVGGSMTTTSATTASIGGATVAHSASHSGPKTPRPQSTLSTTSASAQKRPSSSSTTHRSASPMKRPPTTPSTPSVPSKSNEKPISREAATSKGSLFSATSKDSMEPDEYDVLVNSVLTRTDAAALRRRFLLEQVEPASELAQEKPFRVQLIRGKITELPDSENDVVVALIEGRWKWLTGLDDVSEHQLKEWFGLRQRFLYKS
jgi:hypothetical protein